MSGTLLIAAGPGEWRAAWLEDGAAVELYVERGDSPAAGSVHLGRVVRRTPGLDAVFVDIGTERPGFMPVRNAPPDLNLDEGARVIVQVQREPRQGKGARLSARFKPGPEGPDAQQLAASAAEFEPPRQLDPEPSFAASLALRLPALPKQILANDTAILPELQRVFPNTEIANSSVEDWSIDLDSEFDAALAPGLRLPGGGAVHIAQTAAAVLIDVDTGTPEEGSAERGAVAANLEAAQAIARQIRLRQLGGGIIVDCVGLEGRAAREKVRYAIMTALAGDPTEPQVLGWTRLGHLEIVRPRRGRPLSDVMLEPESARKNGLTLAFEALRVLQREARANPSRNWRLAATPPVAAALRGPAAASLRALEARLGREIVIDVETDRESAAFDIARR